MKKENKLRNRAMVVNASAGAKRKTPGTLLIWREKAIKISGALCPFSSRFIGGTKQKNEFIFLLRAVGGAPFK